MPLTPLRSLLRVRRHVYYAIFLTPILCRCRLRAALIIDILLMMPPFDYYYAIDGCVTR